MSAPTIEQLYFERNACVVLIARMAQLLGFETGLAPDLNAPDWPLLYVELPQGQVSWHLPADFAARELGDVAFFPVPYDGHDFGEKYRRVLHSLEAGCSCIYCSDLQEQRQFIRWLLRDIVSGAQP